MKRPAETQITGLAINLAIFALYSLAVSFYAGTSWQSHLFSGLIFATLTISLLPGFIISEKRNNKVLESIPFIFLIINASYIFFYGISVKYFSTKISAGLFLYLLENFFILLEDTEALIPLIPFWYWLLFIITAAAGYKWKSVSKFLISRADAIPLSAVKISLLIILPVIIISLFLSLTPLFSPARGSLSSTPNPWNELIQNEHSDKNCFLSRRELNIDDKPDIVIFLFESVGAENFDREKSLYLKRGEPVLSAEHFFVPVPHTTVSIYSILTGNYGNYRGRIKLPESIKNNTLPSVLREEGYSPYFLYSGPTYFEGLHELLENSGFTVFNKEYFETSMTGKKYKSFTWGVDDAALLHKTAQMLPDLKGPSLFIIGFSSTHSPYFNPETEKFSRHDNTSQKGRYLNCIDYNIYIMDNIMELFLRYNDNTIFIVLGDHGESFGENGFLRHGFSLYNNEIKVPFYIRHPVFSNAPAYAAGTILDIYPSLLDMLGIKIPPRIQGKSIFCKDYRLNLFLRSWKEGENMGIISGEKKFIYSGKNDRLIELDINDRVIREIIENKEKENFRNFLNSRY